MVLGQNNPGKCGERKRGVSDLGDSGKAIPTFLTCRRSQVDSALGLEGVGWAVSGTFSCFLMKSASHRAA